MPICWDKVGEGKLLGPEIIQDTNEKISVIRERLKVAQDRQKSYTDKHRRDLEFQVGDRVFYVFPHGKVTFDLAKGER